MTHAKHVHRVAKDDDVSNSLFEDENRQLVRSNRSRCRFTCYETSYMQVLIKHSFMLSERFCRRKWSVIEIIDHVLTRIQRYWFIFYCPNESKRRFSHFVERSLCWIKVNMKKTSFLEFSSINVFILRTWSFRIRLKSLK